MSHVGEVRYYKGKFPVEIIVQSKKNWLVKALEPIEQDPKHIMFSCPEGHLFMTYPRLLHKNPRKKRPPKPQISYKTLDLFTS